MHYGNDDNTESSFGAFEEALEGGGCNLQMAERLINSYRKGDGMEYNYYSEWASSLLESTGWEPWFEEYRIPILKLLLKTYKERPLDVDEDSIDSVFQTLAMRRDETQENRELAEIITIILSEHNQLGRHLRNLRTLTGAPWNYAPVADRVVGRRLAEARGRILSVLNPSFMNQTGLSADVIARLLSFIEPYEQETMIRILNEILEKRSTKTTTTAARAPLTNMPLQTMTSNGGQGDDVTKI